MVRINRIYTRTGDDGTTGLVGGDREAKDGPRIEALGEIDELNAWMGMVHTSATQAGVTAIADKVTLILNELFDIGAEVATPPQSAYPGMLVAAQSQITRLEKWIDALTDGVPDLKSFVLPGGSELNAHLHLARTVCRRAERRVISLSKATTLNPLVCVYLNRLSDLLFAMARYEAHHAGRAEYLWVPGKNRNADG